MISLLSPETSWVGRTTVLLIFNEAIVAAIGYVIDRRWPRDRRLHVLMLLSSIAAGVGPNLANLGSSAWIAGQSLALQVLWVPACGALAQGGLWAQTFFTTGMLTDALHARRPVLRTALSHWRSGFGKGAIFGAVFLALMLGGSALAPSVAWLAAQAVGPILTAFVLGALSFPLCRTILESFDGGAPFLLRLKASFLHRINYARGGVAGLAVAVAVVGQANLTGPFPRFVWGAVIGCLSYAGVDLLGDVALIFRGLRRRLQPWRVYALGTVLGAMVGGGLAWYLDGAQVAAISQKLAKYAATSYSAIGKPVEAYIIYPLFSKWGALDLGLVPGAARLLYNESLSGVINWSLAAPLFSINLVLLTAAVSRSLRPLRTMLTREGLTSIAEQLVRVLRWGLWMAPVIYSLLRMAPDPAWYNQDGAVRSIMAVFKSSTLAPESFRSWSLEIFLGLLAYDWLRIVIWFDHMGLRVATLVNLSFVGADALDERAAKALGHRTRTRCIPEGIRRFFTWAPLLIPFYIPRGTEWDRVWTGQETLRTSQASMLPAVKELLWAYVFAAITALVIAAVLWRRARRKAGTKDIDAPPQNLVIGNGLVSLEWTPQGNSFSRQLGDACKSLDIDITRRPADNAETAGKFFYLRESVEGRDVTWSLGPRPCPNSQVAWSVSRPSPTSLSLKGTSHGIECEISVVLPQDEPVEVWEITLTNLENRPRNLDLTSFQRWALSSAAECLRRPAFNALHVGTRFIRPLHAILAHHRLLRDANGRRSSRVALHAVDADASRGVILTGYEDSRQRFLGHGSLEGPAGIQPNAMRPIDDEGLLYTFDPAASLQVSVSLPANGRRCVRFVDGMADDAQHAARLISRHASLAMPDERSLRAALDRSRSILDHDLPSEGVPYRFSDDGTQLHLTGPTPRPWAHVMANPLGYGVVVSNDGAVFSFAGNAQQNGMTPFRLDSSPCSFPGQGIHLVDCATGRGDDILSVVNGLGDAEYTATYSPSSAILRRKDGSLETDLTLFVPPDLPCEIRLLRVTNLTSEQKRLRIVPWFEMMLGEATEDSLGQLETEEDPSANTLFFRNPTNDFESGYAFVTTSLSDAARETIRSRFIGEPPRDLRYPYFAEQGCSCEGTADDGHRIAAFSGEMILPPGGHAVISVVAGFAPSMAEARSVIDRLRDVEACQRLLSSSSEWWGETLSKLRIESNQPEFDRFINTWLPYQVLTSRLWGRTGPEQRSGAWGFRDQLQDVLPFVFLQPDLVCTQILWHAAQQFLEGDALAWWHRAPSGGTGLGARTRATDVHLWLPYVVTRYVAATGDASILDVQVPFLEGISIPRGQEGVVFAPRPSRETASLYEHCRRAIECTLARKGSHGLPLIGTGDWNDGLSAVGPKGKGESVWLAFFLHDVLSGMTPLAEARGDASHSVRWKHEAGLLHRATDGMWRGDRYVRAITDAGAEMLFADALTGAWPVLSGVADPERGKSAVESTLKELERESSILLLHPPFTDASEVAPGRISDYPPGVRENGGQYSHGVSWLVDALVRLGELTSDVAVAEKFRARAIECWWKVSPLDDTGPDRLARYGLPPHQQPADVYDGPGYEGRGGWSWYSGSAARMLSAAYAMLGLRMEGGRLVVESHAFESKGRLTLRRVVWQGKEYSGTPKDSGAPGPL